MELDHEEAPPEPRHWSSRPSIYDILLLFGIFVMLLWPWIFFGMVWAKNGIQMDNHVANVVRNNPHATTYFITLICNIISMIVTSFFSLAITRFAQEFVTRYQPARPFYLTVLFALRHQIWLWGISYNGAKRLMVKNRLLPTILVIICVLTFPHLVSTTTSLIAPIPFNRMASLSGTELDFSSTDPVCFDWFKAHPLSGGCDWRIYNSCLGQNQMVDVLEAGRGNTLELVSNNSQGLAFNQLGAGDGLHFLGSIRGVLPIGPNGVPAFNTLDPSPFSDPQIVAAISYNYTLNHQGLFSNVNCSYQPTSPIKHMSSSNDSVTYNVPSCAALGEASILTNISSFKSVLGTNTLMSWACQSAPINTQPPSYSIYLKFLGFRGGYEQDMGNITCTVSPIQPAIFPVMYQSSRRIFSVGDALSSNVLVAGPPPAFSLLLNYTLIALGSVISQGQNFDSNLVAESVITLGLKSFGLQPYAQNSTYLQLYERMIQGILEYETTYIRLIYSTVSDPPPSCVRAVTGFVKYEVLGWFVTSANIGFLIPMTIINGAAMIVLLLALILAKTAGYLHHPSHPRSVIYDSGSPDEEVPDEWKVKVSFHPTTILKVTANTSAMEEVAKT